MESLPRTRGLRADPSVRPQPGGSRNSGSLGATDRRRYAFAKPVKSNLEKMKATP
jgi:hypothetical protein